MSLKHFRSLCLAAFVAAISFGCISFSTNVHANGQTHPLISPAKQSISLEPGEHYEGTFSVHNVGSEDFSYTVYATPYSAIDENYSIDYTNQNSYTQISEWISFDITSGHLDPGEVQEIKYTVDVPMNVPGGGQYAALMVETGDTRDQHNIGVVNRIGMVLYSDVSGETVKKGKVLENKIPRFFLSPPITATSIVENTGNVHDDAVYILRVYPLFSNEEIYSNEEESLANSRVIMPETRRFVSQSWDGAPRLGIFRVQQEVRIFDDTSIEQKYVIICPLWFIIIIILIIIAVIYWQVSKRRSIKREQKEKTV